MRDAISFWSILTLMIFAVLIIKIANSNQVAYVFYYLDVLVAGLFLLNRKTKKPKDSEKIKFLARNSRNLKNLNSDQYSRLVVYILKYYNFQSIKHITVKNDELGNPQDSYFTANLNGSYYEIRILGQISQITNKDIKTIAASFRDTTSQIDSRILFTSAMGNDHTKLHIQSTGLDFKIFDNRKTIELINVILVANHKKEISTGKITNLLITGLEWLIDKLQGGNAVSRAHFNTAQTIEEKSEEFNVQTTNKSPSFNKQLLNKEPAIIQQPNAAQDSQPQATNAVSIESKNTDHVKLDVSEVENELNERDTIAHDENNADAIVELAKQTIEAPDHNIDESFEYNYQEQVDNTQNTNGALDELDCFDITEAIDDFSGQSMADEPSNIQLPDDIEQASIETTSATKADEPTNQMLLDDLDCFDITEALDDFSGQSMADEPPNIQFPDDIKGSNLDLFNLPDLKEPAEPLINHVLVQEEESVSKLYKTLEVFETKLGKKQTTDNIATALSTCEPKREILANSTDDQASATKPVSKPRKNRTKKTSVEASIIIDEVFGEAEIKPNRKKL